MDKKSFGYKKSKQLAKEIYSKIGNISCPAFNGEMIHFTSDGFTHLIRKGRTLRTENEQKRRFSLIPYIKDIIKNPNVKVTFRQTEEKYRVNRDGKNIPMTSIAKFWTFHAQANGSKVRVVIRQIGPRQKEFQSVMFDEFKK